MFVIDRHRHAVRAACAFANETSANSLLLIAGPPGVGKTELVRWILSTVSARGRRRTRILSARDVASRMVKATRSNTFGQISRQFGDGDCLGLEEMNDLRGKLATLEEFGRVTAQWVAAGARVVCTAACPVHDVAEFERRLPPAPISRIVTLGRPTRSDMQSIINGIAGDAGVNIDRQSVEHLAAWCNGDIRRAVGGIRQLAFHASVGANPSRNPATRA